MKPYAGLVIALTACAGPSDDGPGAATWGPLPNGYASHFAHEIRGADRRLVVFGPGGRTDTAGVYMLRGEATGGHLSIPAELDRVAVLSTTHLPFFSALDAVDRVVGIAHVAQVRDTAFQAALARGAVLELARADGVDRERLLAAAPQVVFDYPFGVGDRQSARTTNSVSVAEYLEEHPLGRAEWIRFFGILLHREERADSLFKAIEHRYAFLRGLNDHLSDRPSVLFGSHWEGAWFAPPGNSYMARLIADAGGRYVFADRMAPGNIAVPLERLLVMADTVDHAGVQLNRGGPVGLLDLAGDPRLATKRGIRYGGFVGNSATSDLFGLAVLEPDQVLRDLRCIFHPSTCSGADGRYFQRIAP